MSVYMYVNIYMQIYISMYLHVYKYIKLRYFVYSINNTLYSTYFLLINCEKVLKLALMVSAGYVFNFLEAHVKFLVF